MHCFFLLMYYKNRAVCPNNLEQLATHIKALLLRSAIGVLECNKFGPSCSKHC